MRTRVRAVALVAAVGISLIGAVIWSRMVGDDTPADAVLAAPGEYPQPGASTNPSLPTDRLPIVELTAADETSVALTTDGRPLVVNLWYSTCPPCARELVDFAEVHAEADASVRFVGVNPYDSAEVMSRFAADRGVRYELLRDPESVLADELAVVAYPVTLFVDGDGRILERTGPLDAEELRERLAAYWSVT